MSGQQRNEGSAQTERQQPSVVIIGAGMTGLLLAIKLREMGITDITLLEKAHTFGGTWRENTYPGVACDVPSHAYTYSFAPNPEWSMHFPPGAEIYSYFGRVFQQYGIDRHARFNQTVTACEYDETGARWTVTTDKGEQHVADLVFCATGILHQPVYPDIPGLDSFAGARFHSSRWDHAVELRGKRIGVIGTGSTACQIVPAVSAQPDTQVTVFQRSPQWLVSMKDRRFSEHEKARFVRQPWRIRLIRRLSALVYSTGTAALTGDGWWDRFTHKLMTRNGLNYLRSAVKDVQLRQKLTPDYTFGCRRVVISDRYYEAIQRPNVTLVTEGIAAVEPQGIRTRDGVLHPLDVLVMATGFNAAAFMRPMQVLGRCGLSIEQAWREKISAYRSLFVPGFPNFFLMLGPNSPIGNQSVIEISEHQTDYALRLVQLWRAGKLPVIEARPQALRRWRDMIREKMRHTVWVSGCRSWYLDADGDALAWPDSWNAWVRMMKTLQLDDFEHVTQPVTDAEPATELTSA